MISRSESSLKFSSQAYAGDLTTLFVFPAFPPPTGASCRAQPLLDFFPLCDNLVSYVCLLFHLRLHLGEDREKVSVVFIYAGNRYWGTTKPLHVVKKSGPLTIEQCMEDVFYLSCLAWTRPEDCSRDPITTKLNDRWLGEEGAEQKEETETENLPEETT